MKHFTNFKGALSGLRQVLATDNFKNVEKYFLFHPKISFCY